MKKFLSNTIVQLLIAVIIGLLAGFVVNDAVLEVVICIKHITGQIIFFLVPLIILGFIAPSIAHLRSNASKMLLFAFGYMQKRNHIVTYGCSEKRGSDR